MLKILQLKPKEWSMLQDDKKAYTLKEYQQMGYELRKSKKGHVYFEKIEEKAEQPVRIGRVKVTLKPEPEKSKKLWWLLVLASVLGILAYKRLNYETNPQSAGKNITAEKPVEPIKPRKSYRNTHHSNELGRHSNHMPL